MIPFRRILFPVDYSEACLAIVPYVTAMARQFSSELTLVKAFGVPTVDEMEVRIEGEWPIRVPEMDQIEELQLQRLREFAAGNFAGMKVHSVVRFTDPASAIEEEVKHSGVDLVMLATHGHGAFRRLLLGSVTAKVLHDLDCAVWTGTHQILTPAKPVIACKSIVCALGLTEESEAVLRAAASLASSCGGSLHIVHAVETPPAAYQVDFSPYRVELIEAADIALRKLRDRAQVKAATINVESGSPSAVIHAQACAHKADLVVTGRGHSQGRAARVWSALYSIVRDAPCPVLSI